MVKTAIYFCVILSSGFIQAAAGGANLPGYDRNSYSFYPNYPSSFETKESKIMGVFKFLEKSHEAKQMLFELNTGIEPLEQDFVKFILSSAISSALIVSDFLALKNSILRLGQDFVQTVAPLVQNLSGRDKINALYALATVKTSQRSILVEAITRSLCIKLAGEYKAEAIRACSKLEPESYSQMDSCCMLASLHTANKSMLPEMQPSFYDMAKALKSPFYAKMLPEDQWTESFLKIVNYFQQKTFIDIKIIFFRILKLNTQKLERLVNAVIKLGANASKEEATAAFIVLSSQGTTYTETGSISYHEILSNRFAGLRNFSSVFRRCLDQSLPESLESQALDSALYQRHFAENDRHFEHTMEFSLRIMDSYLNQPLPPLQIIRGNQNVRVVSQEAISQEGPFLAEAYERMATHEDIGPLFARLLPTLENLEEAFTQAAHHMEQLLETIQAMKISKRDTFIAHNALRTLRLFQGDTSIERYRISTVHSYQTSAIRGLPNIRQIFVLAYRLMERTKQKTFIENFLFERFGSLSAWQEWSRRLAIQMPNFEKILMQHNVALALQQDQAIGSPFVNAIQKLLEGDEQDSDAAILATHTLPLIRSYYTKLREDFNPLIEALYMVMRGHNKDLFDSNEPNKPACSRGAYLGLMKAIAELDVVAASSAREVLAGVEIIACGNGLL